MINQDIVVYINGEPFVCSTPMKLIDLVQYLNFNLDLIVIEYNKEILSSTNLSTVLLQHMDMIEVITVVGGG